MKQNMVLITDAVHPCMLQVFEEKGWTVDYKPDITYEETRSMIKNYQGLIINSKIKCDQAFLDLTDGLTFIGRLGSGREVVDINYAIQKGIHVYFSPEGNKNAVAEHTLGMLLMLVNQLHIADREVRQKIWSREARRGWELAGKTIGIVGFGHTGSQFAKKLRGMEMNVLTYDKYLSPNYADAYDYITEVSLNELMTTSDIISFHLPLAEDTHHLADQAFLKACKKHLIIINTSRGHVVDTRALVDGLENGLILGACLDVFENEKPNTFSTEEDEMYKKLYSFSNVVLTPHVAGWTMESKYLLSKILMDKIFNTPSNKKK